jgi:hypothetical protein
MIQKEKTKIDRYVIEGVIGKVSNIVSTNLKGCFWYSVFGI